MSRIVRLSEARMAKSETEGREGPDGAEPGDIEAALEEENRAAAAQEPVQESAPEEEVSTGPDPAHVRIVEALLFAASEPLAANALASALPAGTDIPALLAEVQRQYESRGVQLVQVAGKWQFRTAEDLAFLLRKQAVEERRLSRAAIETLAIIAYHQPVTRAEVEDIRGVMVSKGTVDTLMEVGWVRIRGRRRTPGRPVTYGTTEAFMIHFGLDNISDLPGMDELRGAGFLDAVPPQGFTVPNPSDALAEDEDPYEGEEETVELIASSEEVETD